MASTLFESLLAATMDQREPEIMKQVDTASPIGAWLDANKCNDPWTEGGYNIETNISVNLNDTVAARDYKTEINLKEQNPLRTVSLPVKIVNGSLVWYKHDEDANSSKAKVVGYVTDLIDNLTESLRQEMALQYWEDGTGVNWDGLGAIISATNTYMTMNRSTTGNEYWKAKTGAQFTVSIGGVSRTFGPFNTAEPLLIRGGTDGGIEGLYTACCDNGGADGPDLIITTEALYRRLFALVAADSSSTVLYSQKMADLDYPENIQYKGATITWDTNCPSGGVYALNSKYIKNRPYTTSGSNGLYKSPIAERIANGSLSKVMIIEKKGNLTCRRPGKCGALTGKTTS